MCIIGWFKTSKSLPHSWLITGFATRVIRRVPRVEQQLLPEHLSWHPVFSVIPDAGSLVFYVVFCRSLIVLLCFFCCIVCLSSIYDYDYPFVIFKLYFHPIKWKHNVLWNKHYAFTDCYLFNWYIHYSIPKCIPRVPDTSNINLILRSIYEEQYPC